MYELGTQIPLNPPKIDFDLGTITQKIMVESYKKTDEAMLAKICQIAKEKGVTTLIALDEDHIKEALEKACAKKARRRPGYSTIQVCPVCDRDLIYSAKYCYGCGQKVEWKD